MAALTEIRGWAVPDPQTTKRTDYTARIVDWEIPANANPEYRSTIKQQQELLQLLHDDPAMEPNRQQTFMTPANSKNKVYFMWDFVQRNLLLLYQLKSSQPPAEELLDRVTHSALLINDTTGMTNMMFPGDQTVFR